MQEFKFEKDLLKSCKICQLQGKKNVPQSLVIYTKKFP